ncbi:hypothetical protein Zmor_021115 [Zophobas morio]|uniref:Limulus clotting factor C n=1 Tax=Zophobas morio TaxID=2755281 RepID=A0AA38I4X6_9CUCU|nr:hypothetical protein Zmor_021115 [Zophobas morio]
MCGALLFFIKVFSLCILVSDSNCTQWITANYTRVSRQARPSSCTLPPYPEFGRWTIYEVSSQKPPGELVPPGTVLEVSCDTNHKLDSHEIVTCIRGVWRPEIGNCLRTCPTINSTVIMTVSCTFNEQRLKSCADPFDGTIARFQCARYFENQGQEKDPFRLCSNGKWSGSWPTCVPRCGQPVLRKEPTLIVGGNETQKREYPWQVALYSAFNKELLCGGTLLNQRVVLTAAHCITDNKGKLLPKENYVVAVGKYFRKYDHPDDAEDAQFSSVYDTYIPRQYKAQVQHYFGDVGIIVTTKIFDISASVRPICVMWESKRHQVLADPSRQKYAYVSGWGYTIEHKNLSDALRYLKVPLITDDDCNEKLSEDLIEYMTDDKLCAGFLNSSTSVCKGDSGGGLVAKYKERYYIIGIVSISPQSESAYGGCNSQTYTLYTRFSYYIESFILEKEARFRPRLDCQDPLNCDVEIRSTTPTQPTTEVVTESSESTRCTLPTHPESGKWNIIAGSVLQSGSSVTVGTVLKLECNKGFKMDGQNLIHCDKDKWSSEPGRCLKICPPRVNTATMKVTCIYREKEIENCNEPLEGSIAKFRCAPFYEDSQLKRRPIHICNDGTWDQQLPQCEPICGQKTVEATQLIVGGTNVTKGDYPWNVALYTNDQKEFICSGSLISQRIVVTAAHCIADEGGKVLDKNNYIIAVGKYYRNYGQIEDPETRLSQVKAMFVPETYKGSSQNYMSDIGILVSKKTFTLSRRIQPVCLDVSQNYNLATGEMGYVTGWGDTSNESSIASAVLKELKVPSVSLSECRTNLPEDFEVYLTSDKMCAGYLRKGESICRGDDGGGLVFKHNGRYYLTAVTSLSPASFSDRRDCNSQNYGLYTKVSSYLNSFILSKLAEYNS